MGKISVHDLLYTHIITRKIRPAMDTTPNIPLEDDMRGFIKKFEMVLRQVKTTFISGVGNIILLKDL